MKSILAIAFTVFVLTACEKIITTISADIRLAEAQTEPLEDDDAEAEIASALV